MVKPIIPYNEPTMAGPQGFRTLSHLTTLLEASTHELENWLIESIACIQCAATMDDFF